MPTRITISRPKAKKILPSFNTINRMNTRNSFLLASSLSLDLIVMAPVRVSLTSPLVALQQPFSIVRSLSFTSSFTPHYRFPKLVARRLSPNLMSLFVPRKEWQPFSRTCLLMGSWIQDTQSTVVAQSK
jgi:hypothetical protein